MIGVFNKWCYKEIIKAMFFCLASFYLLYILIDYSSRISSYQAIRFEWMMLAEYYGLIFIRRLDVLLPFALLIATASTLQTIWQLHGWVPLLLGGKSIRRLMFPFYTVAVLASIFLLYNEQTLIPLAMKRLNHLESLYFHKGEGISELNTRSILRLKDGQVLFFDAFDAKSETLFDVWYLPTWNEIWHMEKLDISQKVPLGTTIDHFEKEELSITNKGFFETKDFEGMHVGWQDLLESAIDPLNLSISDLFLHLKNDYLSPQERAEFTATFLKKILYPMLAILAVLAIVPYFVTFKREASFFLYYLGAVLAFIGFYLLVSSLYVIAAANVFSPYLALVLPFSALLGFTLWKQKRGSV